MTDQPKRHFLLPHFRYLHGALSDAASPWVVGRNHEAQVLADRLMFSKGGAFLVTGFRGVGKTTFVRRALQLIQHRASDYGRSIGPFTLVDVWIDLARPLSPSQLMHILIRQLYLRFRETGVLRGLDKELRKDLQTAFLRTSFEISSRSLKTEETSTGASVGYQNAAWLGLQFLGKLDSSSKKGKSEEEALKYLPYDDRQAEFDIMVLAKRLSSDSGRYTSWWHHVLQRLSRGWLGQRSNPERLKLVFVLDELDKLQTHDAKDEKGCLETLLESLKTVFTGTELSFVFIAGKEVYERWRTDVALGDSIYESIFAFDLYLPCLWSNQSDILTNCFPESATAEENTLLDLGRYLRFVGRGIPRKVLRELNSQVQWEDGQPFISVSAVKKKYIGLYAKLQKVLEECPEVFGEDSSLPSDARLDRRRLFVYYTLDWMFSQRNRTFTLAQVQEATERLNLGLGVDWKATREFTRSVMQLLVKRTFLACLVGQQTHVALNVDESTEQYRLSEWVLLALGAEVGDVKAGETTHYAGRSGEGVPAQNPGEFTHFFSDLSSLKPGEPNAPKRPGIKTLGRYTVMEMIARGGMSAVYKVRSPAGITFAAKVLSVPAGMDEDLAQRFNREIEILKRLDHPAVARIIDAELESDPPFFVMEYINGFPLAIIVKRLRPIPPAGALTIADRLAR